MSIGSFVAFVAVIEFGWSVAVVTIVMLMVFVASGGASRFARGIGARRRLMVSMERLRTEKVGTRHSIIAGIRRGRNMVIRPYRMRRSRNLASARW